MTTETPTSTFEDASIPPWAVRGAQVVCIHNQWGQDGVIQDALGRLTYPVFKETYTVREVIVRYAPEYGAVLVGIRLAEITNPLIEAGSGAGEEISWHVGGFRPVVGAAAKRKRKIAVPENV